MKGHALVCLVDAVKREGESEDATWPFTYWRVLFLGGGCFPEACRDAALDVVVDQSRADGIRGGAPLEWSRVHEGFVRALFADRLCANLVDDVRLVLWSCP